jgi:aspartate/methionine/tyrosine aminotransferase
MGINPIHAPGHEEEGWAYSEEGIRASVRLAEKTGRRVSGMILTSPDNPTGLTLPPERQVALVKTALEAGVSFVLLDWMYHRVTDEAPMDLNTFLPHFTPDERKRLIILDGITKCLGGSNIRNCHLIASQEVTNFIANRASHQVVASYFSMAVAQAAYELGIDQMSRGIVEPANASRRLLVEILD